MRHDGAVSDCLASQVDGGAAFSVQGTRYVPYASFGNTHAYTACTHPSEANMLRIALPMPLGGTLYPAPVLWVTERGLEEHYGAKRASTREGVVLYDDESMDDASSVSASDNGDVLAPEASDSDAEEDEGEEEDDESDDEVVKTAASAFPE